MSRSLREHFRAHKAALSLIHSVLYTQLQKKRENLKICLLLEDSTYVERHWKVSNETLWNYTKDTAVNFKFQLFYFDQFIYYILQECNRIPNLAGWKQRNTSREILATGKKMASILNLIFAVSYIFKQELLVVGKHTCIPRKYCISMKT